MIDKHFCKERKKDEREKSMWQLREHELSQVNMFVWKKIWSQDYEYGPEFTLSPHQFFGLVTEEIGEIAKALNETFIPNQQDPVYAGLDNIQEEVVQTIALLYRMMANLNTLYEGVERNKPLVRSTGDKTWIKINAERLAESRNEKEPTEN